MYCHLDNDRHNSHRRQCSSIYSAHFLSLDILEFCARLIFLRRNPLVDKCVYLYSIPLTLTGRFLSSLDLVASNGTFICDMEITITVVPDGHGLPENPTGTDHFQFKLRGG